MESITVFVMERNFLAEASLIVPEFTISVRQLMQIFLFCAHSLFFSFYIYMYLGIQCCIGDGHNKKENEKKREWD